MAERKTRPRLKSVEDFPEREGSFSDSYHTNNFLGGSGGGGVPTGTLTRRKSEKVAMEVAIPKHPSSTKKAKKEKKMTKTGIEYLPPPPPPPNLALSDVIKAGEQLTSPSAVQDEYQNKDVYRIMDILLRGTGLADPFVAVAIQFVEQLVKTKNTAPANLVQKRKYLTSTIGLAQRSIANIDRIISAIRIQKTIRGYLVRQRLKKLEALYSTVVWSERNNTFLRWLTDEEDYGKKLATIIDDYKTPLDLKKDIILSTDSLKIFSNIHILLETQKSVIACLKGVLCTHPHIRGLGDKWCELAPYLKNYGSYVENSAHSLTTLSRLINTNSKFKMFISSVNVSDNMLSLDALLQLPITRIAKYQEFLKEMLKNTPIKHPDYDSLNKAYEVMKSANLLVEKNLNAAKNRDNILEVQRRLQNCEIPLYVEPRTYIGEAGITLMIKGKRQHRLFILFNDIAIFAKQVKKDLLVYKNSITFNATSEATDKLAMDSNGTFKAKKKQDNPVLITNCESDIQGPVIILFKNEEHEVWLKRIQDQVNALKRASCIVFGAPITEMAKKCIPNASADMNLTFKDVIANCPEFDTLSLVPPFLLILISHLENFLTEKGIYRVSGLDTDIKELRSILDKVKPATNISQFPPHVIADVLKLYFRELPEPLLTYDFFGKAMSDLHKIREDEHLYATSLRDMLKQLPLINYCILKTLARHLCNVEKFSADNLMGSSNLAIVFGPTLLSPKEESIEHTLMMPRVYAVIQCMIEQFPLVFGEDNNLSYPNRLSIDNLGASSSPFSLPTSSANTTIPRSNLTNLLPEPSDSLFENKSSVCDDSDSSTENLPSFVSHSQSSLPLLPFYNPTPQYPSTSSSTRNTLPLQETSNLRHYKRSGASFSNFRRGEEGVKLTEEDCTYNSQKQSDLVDTCEDDPDDEMAREGRNNNLQLAKLLKKSQSVVVSKREYQPQT